MQFLKNGLFFKNALLKHLFFWLGSLWRNLCPLKSEGVTLKDKKLCVNQAFCKWKQSEWTALLHLGLCVATHHLCYLCIFIIFARIYFVDTHHCLRSPTGRRVHRHYPAPPQLSDYTSYPVGYHQNYDLWSDPSQPLSLVPFSYIAPQVTFPQVYQPIYQHFTFYQYQVSAGPSVICQCRRIISNISLFDPLVSGTSVSGTSSRYKWMAYLLLRLGR